MKKTLTSLCLISAVSIGFSQSLRLFNGATEVTNTIITVPISATASLQTDIDVHNITSSAVTFKVRRTILNPPLDPDCILYFCTGITCFPPSALTVYTQGGTGTTLAGMTNLVGAQGLLAHFDVGPNCAETYVKYQAYVSGVAGDTSTVTIHYACTAGVNDIEKANGGISNAYPNPANSIISIKYNVNEFAQKGKIVFYDMLGKAVKDVELTDKQGVSKISITDLNAGIYFYTLVVDSKATMTKKLVINTK